MSPKASRCEPSQERKIAVELIADTDNALTMCSCSAGDDQPY
jgi:hypothetical protein